MIILAILLWGMFAGWIANMILGGSSRPKDWGPLLVAGLSGSFVGGLLVNLIRGNGIELATSGLIGSVVGAILLLLIWRAIAPKVTPAPESGGPTKTKPKPKPKPKSKR